MDDLSCPTLSTGSVFISQVVWCNYFGDMAIAVHLDDKLWTSFCVLSQQFCRVFPIVARYRDKHASPTWNIWDKDAEFGIENSEAASSFFPNCAHWLCGTLRWLCDIFMMIISIFSRKRGLNVDIRDQRRVGLLVDKDDLI